MTIGLLAASGGEVPAVNAVNFDGTNDYLTLASDLSGNADSKLLTFSFWLRRAAVTGANYGLYEANTGDNAISFNSADRFTGVFKDTGAAIALRFTSTNSFTSTSDWVHICGSMDMTDTGKRHLYVDGVDDSPGWNNYVNTDLDFTKGSHGIGSLGGATDKFNGDMAEVYINFGEYIDLSVAANLQKFRTASGKPAPLGTDGSSPTGTSPIIYLSGETSTWHTNDGTGTGFTENGALTTATTSPSD